MKKFSKKFKLGNNYIISDSSKCFIIAEIGINHNGSINLAKKMILAAKKSGADAVKFQNYDVDDFIKNKKSIFKYKYKKKIIFINEYEMFKKYQLTENDLRELKSYSDKIGIIFFSTPTSKNGIKSLKKLGVNILKNGSDFLTNLELIKEMAKSNIPTIISTGMSDLSDIDKAVKIFQKNGGRKLILLHCTSQYPTPYNEVNLKKIKFLQSRYNCLVGFSDHTKDNISASLSIAFNAKVVEKHFTLDKKLKGPDHAFSSNPIEFTELVNFIRSNEIIIGNGNANLSKQELKNKLKYNLSAYYNLGLNSGHILERKDIYFSRPGGGLSQFQIRNLIGKKLSSKVRANSKVKDNHFQ